MVDGGLSEVDALLAAQDRPWIKCYRHVHQIAVLDICLIETACGDYWLGLTHGSACITTLESGLAFPLHA